MSPTGEARHLELGSYVTENGFGHEEWLFNLAWMVGAYHYSFLQPVNRSFNNLSGQTIHVLLYTVSPIRDRLYVGEIRNCEVLTSAQAADAVHHYRMQGWLDIMANQVKHVDGRFDRISEAVPPTDIFNIRFRKADVQIYDPFSPAAKDDLVWKLNRYTLGSAADAIESQWRNRKGKSEPPSTQTITRNGTPSLTYDPIHKRLQSDLFCRLQAKFGKGNVVLEENYIDITVRDGERITLIEIKTDPEARLAIRHAIGQLLEYAYYSPSKQLAPHELLIVAPALLDEIGCNYLQRVRTQFQIPISYASYSEGDPLPSVFV